MNRSLTRAYVLELLGTFGLVYFAAGAVCVNHLTAAAQPGQQPGLVGVALAQGLLYAVALAATFHVSGGGLNPAITVMLWVFNRLDSARASWLIGAQLVGAVLAGLCLRCTFDEAVLREARAGTPHLNLAAYGGELNRATLAAGTAVELVLTFFLTFAIFSAILDKARWRPGGLRPASPAEEQSATLRTLDARLAGLLGGLALCACALVGYALTGAAVNPARWFGTVFWEMSLGEPAAGAPGPLSDTFVYVAGPTAGALLAGLVHFRVAVPAAEEQTAAATPPPGPAKGKK
jgi:glycerol uptake facilitator-like aquaporin